jgi:ABC-type nitrate/sulfonate/bicarbonate transport system substrate-binding protein
LVIVTGPVGGHGPIAEEEGLFAKNGANVQMKWFDGYLESLQALSCRTIRWK